MDTEGKGRLLAGLHTQILEMIRSRRAPEWIADNIIITGDPDVVIDAYRNRLQLF